MHQGLRDDADCFGPQGARICPTMTDTPGRLLRLLSLLQQRTLWSGPELADRLGVTARTVRRDVDRLRTLGYPVDAEPGTAGGYRLGTGASLPPLLLDDDEATAIALGLGLMASGTIGGIQEPALAALAKLDRMLPSHIRARVAAVRTTAVPMGGGERVDPGILLTAARAAADRERLLMTYVDREGRESERRVDPYRLVSTGRRWYLVAFDVDRGAWRTLRVDRVAAFVATGHHFRLDDPPDAVELVSRASGVAPYRHVAKVVVHAPQADVAAKVPPTVGLLEAHPHGTLLTVGADDLAFLAGHLVALDLPFQALEPPELRQLLQRAGARLAEAHP
jgi:predicted DNA-binding transcriptional regulator YafY